MLEIASLVETHVTCVQRGQLGGLEIAQVLHALGSSKADVAEIFSPERFTSRANEFGLRPGFAADLSVQKSPGGEHWVATACKTIVAGWFPYLWSFFTFTEFVKVQARPEGFRASAEGGEKASPHVH